MIDEILGWGIIAVVVLVAFFSFGNGERYESSCSNDKMFVLDKKTGEVWVSCDSRRIYSGVMKMIPVEYEKKGQWSSDVYTPEESRNDKNASWTTILKRNSSDKKDE